MPMFEKLLYRFTVIFGSAVLCLMMLQIVVDVFMRSWVGAGLPATAELVGRYYMVLVSFLPIAYVEWRRRHVEATIFTDMLPKSAQHVLHLLAMVLGLVIYGLLTWGTTQEALSNTAQNAYVEAGTINFPIWPSHWILPFSFGLMSLVLLLRLWNSLRGAPDPEPDEPGVIGSGGDEQRGQA